MLNNVVFTYKISTIPAPWFTIRVSKEHLTHIALIFRINNNYLLPAQSYLFKSKIKLKFLRLVNETIFALGC